MNNTEYNKILRLVSKDESIFVGFVKLVTPANDTQVKHVYDHSRSFTNVKAVQDIIEPIIVKNVEKALAKKRIYGRHGKELPKVIRKYEGIMPDTLKKRILHTVCGSMDSFYPYAKKELLNVTAGWIDDEETAIKIVQNHHRLLDVNALESLLTHISNGIDHESLKDFRETSLPFVARKLQAMDLTVPENRAYLINSIAKMPSLIKNLSMTVTVTLDDLRNLPPARRFDFLRFIHEPLFGRYNSYYKNWWPRTLNTQQIKKGRAHERYKKLQMERISRDDIKHVLFAVSIRKNEEVAAWYDRYDTYLSKTKK